MKGGGLWDVSKRKVEVYGMKGGGLWDVSKRKVEVYGMKGGKNHLAIFYLMDIQCV